MTVHFKVAGEWEQVDRPYLKVDGAHTPVKEVWVKDAGEWVQSYEHDVTPPDIPLVSLEIVETRYWEGRVANTGRHIKVGVRSPLGAHDSDLKRIRVLTTYNDKAPTTQYGGTYTSRATDGHPNEPWSDFSYNGFNGSSASKDSSDYIYKNWPRNAAKSSQLEGQRFYHFTAWAEDLNGNWSAANAANIWVPRQGAQGSDRIVKEARFQPLVSGSMVNGTLVEGDLVQSSPDSWGIWFYGTQLLRIGQEGAADIRSAQVYIPRETDTGSATANVYLYWHEVAGPEGLPPSGVRNNVTLVGTLNQGEAKWFDLPAAFITQLVARNVRGFGLNLKDPAKASAFANDYSAIKSIEDNPRSGEFHVVWSETP